nr:AMP-binding protein [Mesorhizobium caraganae]
MDPGSLLMLREHRPTILIALPSVLFGLVRAKNARREDFSSFRLLCAGGDKMPLELALEVTALSGLSVNELYGMSEIGVATINPPDGLNKAGSIGRQIVGYQISIRDDNGNELPPGAQGRLWINSPCNMVGYWGDADATRATIRDGWLDTGDVMKIDEDGYLWFCGRRKQIIVHDGSNISPQDVEEALMRHPAVAIAGVVGSLTPSMAKMSTRS